MMRMISPYLNSLSCLGKHDRVTKINIVARSFTRCTNWQERQREFWHEIQNHQPAKLELLFSRLQVFIAT